MGLRLARVHLPTIYQAVESFGHDRVAEVNMCVGSNVLWRDLTHTCANLMD